MTENVIVYQHNGQPAVSSRDVAEQFGKEHRNVIQSIKNLIAENSALTFMFIEDTYTAGTGKKYPMYYMNRDGFTLLAMGFTGKEALAWKLKYIQAFNMMEERLKAQEIKAAMPPMDARTMEAQARLNNSRVDAAKLLMKLGDRAALQYQREDVYAYALHALIGTTPKNTERIESVNRFWLKEYDMYPQFWTPRIGGIFMKYSYEYKKNCIELYRQGKWPETPDGIKQENFRISVRRWSRREKSCGTESLQKNQKKMWSADEKYELIAKVLAGVSITESAISAGVEPSLLSQWVRCYKMKGYQGLAAQRKGRPPKEPDMKKKIVPAELTPSEREELIRLRAENEYLRTENEVIKKRIALRQEKFAAQLKAKKLHSSTNSEEKDTL